MLFYSESPNLQTFKAKHSRVADLRYTCFREASPVTVISLKQSLLLAKTVEPFLNNSRALKAFRYSLHNDLGASATAGEIVHVLRKYQVSTLKHLTFDLAENQYRTGWDQYLRSQIVARSLWEFTGLASLDIGQESLLGLHCNRPDQSLDRPLDELVDILPAYLKSLTVRYCDPSIESCLMDVAAVRAEMLPNINHVTLYMAFGWVSEERLREAFQGVKMVFHLRHGPYPLVVT